ncbi:MAG: hypothetical protein A3K19_12905 [Lentisphaerae bacterium RIFOXYB12_FULL_65_16]|nr:MAG: hypothetical protein A3K18_04800 [Lentisphaerae bacterium RIFOXYA12_64_32]OGV87211.1 MAG: hypothetical protein A3K19_12905 [Lentisphaerae bacterium RIFOXYB12_FULL_65_16]
MQVPFLDLKTQYETMAVELNEAVTAVMKRGDFILGKEVGLFEQEFAAFCGVRHAVGVASGTDALILALMADGIGPGDEVITAANTFIATVLAISAVGAKPVLVDIDPTTDTLDIDKATAAVTARTRAVIPVHLYGQTADMDRVLQLARTCNLKVIEDACQAHGADFRTRMAGSMGHAGCFSFYPGKNLGAYGDGGMVVTDDGDLAARLRMLRNYGQRVKYCHELRGMNSRLDTLQAAVLRVKLKRLPAWNEARRAHACRYNEQLKDSGVVTPVEAPGRKHIYHLYVVRTQNREGLRQHLEGRGVAVGIHYPVPVHLQAAYKDLGYAEGAFPITEQHAAHVLSLPMFPELTEEQIGYTVTAVREAAAR